jgi:hypothetical protein
MNVKHSTIILSRISVNFTSRSIELVDTNIFGFKSDTNKTLELKVYVPL